jgi:hypothetical protein
VPRTLSDAEKQRLVDVVAQSVREGLCQVSAGELDAGWQKLEQSLSDGKYRSVPIVRGYATRWYVRGIVFASMILGVGIVADWARTQREPAPLAFVVEGASVGSAQGIEAQPDAPAELVFSDQSRVKLAPKTKVSVLSMDTHGARVSLANGDLDVSVSRREKASWRFEAGPFIVAVKGTSFHLGYQADRGRLAVQMHDGVVEVKGPSPDRKLTLRGGESLELFANGTPVERRPAEVVSGKEPLGEQPSAATESPAPQGQAGRAAAQRIRPHAPEPRAEKEVEESWAQLIGRGEFSAVVKDAEAQGLDVALSRASAAELTALADAARYTRRYDVAKQALVRVRERFAGSNRSGDAAFFLGRLAEAEPSSQAALSWYETYLRESPRGAYAGEALGREIALFSQSDRARARVAARQYLERFPHGSQAGLARSLVQSADE